jgi:protein involved in ribonucleotide reduction
MKVVYASLTGNVKRFTNNLPFESVQIPRVGNLVVNEPFVLIIYTTGHGQIPKEVVNFMNHSINASNIVGVVGSGNRNWGEEWFCYSAKTVAKEFNIPLLHTIENSGYPSDVGFVTNKIKELEEGMS